MGVLNLITEHSSPLFHRESFFTGGALVLIQRGGGGIMDPSKQCTTTQILLYLSTQGYSHPIKNLKILSFHLTVSSVYEWKLWCDIQYIFRINIMIIEDTLLVHVLDKFWQFGSTFLSTFGF